MSGNALVVTTIHYSTDVTLFSLRVFLSVPKRAIIFTSLLYEGVKRYEGDHVALKKLHEQVNGKACKLSRPLFVFPCKPR